MHSSVDALLDRVRQRRLVKGLLESGEARHLREGAGLTQGQVAELVGVQASAVARWESGERFPQGKRLAGYGELLTRLREAS